MNLNHGKKNLEQERRWELNTAEPVQWLSAWVRAAKRDSLNSTPGSDPHAAKNQLLGLERRWRRG